MRKCVTRCGLKLAVDSARTPRSAAYESSRLSPGLIESVRPSPANASLSRMLKLPPSRVSGLELVSHNARKGRGDPRDRFQSEIFSACTWACTMGTREDSFL